MPKYIGTIDAGFGPVHELIEAENEDAANAALYELWLQYCEDNCDRRLRSLSPELAEQLDVEFFLQD